MKNKSIEAYRFLFSIVIALYHLRAQIGQNFFESGYTIVEFFFVLSGFLMAQSLCKKVDTEGVINVGQETFAFMKKKIKALYPHYLFSLIICWLISILILRTVALKEAIAENWTEIFMLQMTGLNSNGFTGNSADWYVSSLVCAFFVCSALFLKYKKTFLYVLAPIIATSIYVFLYKNVGHLGSIRAYRINFLDGTLRAFAGVSLGCICYCIYVYVAENYSHTKLSKAFFTAFDLVCLSLIFMRIGAAWKTEKDFLMLPVYMGLIISVFLKASYISDILDNNFSLKLGSISYAIFLNHTIFRNVFKLFTMKPVIKLVVYISAVIIFSIFSTYLIKKISSTRLVSDPLGLIFKRKQ